MKLAKRVQELPPYLFVGISKAIAKKKEEGIEVISFGIGDPDIPTPNNVLNRLKSASIILFIIDILNQKGYLNFDKLFLIFIKKDLV